MKIILNVYLGSMYSRNGRWYGYRDSTKFSVYKRVQTLQKKNCTKFNHLQKSNNLFCLGDMLKPLSR